MPDSFVGSVVQVDEIGFPISAEGLFIYRKSMILGGNETLVGSAKTDRLVVGPVSIFQFIGLRPCGKSKELIAHADSENRFVSLQGNFQMVNGFPAKDRITRSVGDKESIPIQGIEIIVPRDPQDRRPPGCKAAKNLMLDATVDQDDFFRSVTIDQDFPATDFCDLVFGIRVSDDTSIMEMFIPS